MSGADPSVRIVPIADSGGDARGGSFPFSLSTLVPRLEEAFGPPFPLQDAHVTTLRPGCVRGNHYHARRQEILFVLPGAEWSLWWDSGEGTAVCSRSFDGAEPVAVLVSPLCTHAVRNDGGREMHIVGLSDTAYDEANPDVYPRKVV